jgi:hypothetical protein
MDPLDQPFGDQPIHRTAQGVAIDAKARGQLRLGRQPVTFVVALLDLATQGCCNLRPDGNPGLSDKLWQDVSPESLRGDV